MQGMFVAQKVAVAAEEVEERGKWCLGARKEEERRKENERERESLMSSTELRDMGLQNLLAWFEIKIYIKEPFGNNK